MKRKKTIPWNIFIAIIGAMFFGTLVGNQATVSGVSIYSIIDTVGTLFLNALTLVVIPLVSASIITGISRIGNEVGFKRIGAKIFMFYLGTSLLAILVGLLFVNLFAPGVGQDISNIAASSSLIQIQENVGKTGSNIAGLLLSVIPNNIFYAISQGNMLGIIFFSLIFGYCISKIESQAGTTLQHFFQGVFQATLQMTRIIMKFLPYGVFCLVSKVFMNTGISSLSSVALFFLTVVVGLMVFMLVCLPLLLHFIGKVNSFRHLKAMAPALITAFSTSSSSATLPITIDCAEKRAGVSNRICSLVIPLGTSVNMSGSALYECVAAMFVAQCYGIELSFSTQFVIVFMALITSIGIAGIPSASLVAVLIILKAVGLPPEGIGLFIAVDRILDMCRTTVNVFSDSCCAVLVAKSEGETKVLTKEPVDIV